MVRRNSLIIYILSFTKNTWFWLGIWIFYYLQFTNYAGIGLIETTLIVTFTLTEIPTGAIADLVGKKKTLILSFLLQTIGSFIMAFAINFEMLIFSVFILCIGGSFYSGTIDAILFDTLKQHGQEDDYDKKISTVNMLSLLAPAVCGLIGGFLYIIHPRLPFIASSVGLLVGLHASLFLIEPTIDTVKFSLQSFILQTKQGLRELFKSTSITHQTLSLLSVGFIVVICSEMLDSFLGFEFGFTPEQLGILWSIIFLVSAFASRMTPFIRNYSSDNLAIFVTGMVIALSLIVSPIVGLAAGGIFLMIRVSLEGVFGNLMSIVVNTNTQSQYRATTLSTFNMIKNIPYVAFAYLIGSLSDTISARNTAFAMGGILLTLLFVQAVMLHNKPARETV